MSTPLLNLTYFFSGLVENVFEAQLGVPDTAIHDYLSNLLVRFVRQDSLYKIRDLTGRPLEDVATMLEETNQRMGVARRQAFQHIGDFTLFWCGLYPESLRKMQNQSKRDYFLDYCAQGKRSYFIASTIDPEPDDPVPNDLLATVGQEYEMCAYGLREVRREWERRDDSIPLRPILLN